MAKIPQSAANYYLNRRARGVTRSEALQDVLKHLQTSENPEYQAAAPAFESGITAAGGDEDQLKALATRLVKSPKLDPNEPPGLLPVQPGEIADMERAAVPRAAAVSMLEAVPQIGLMGLTMGSGMLGAKAAQTAAEPLLVKAAQYGPRAVRAVSELVTGLGSTAAATTAQVGGTLALGGGSKLAEDLAKLGMGAGSIQTLFDTIAGAAAKPGPAQAVMKAVSGALANIYGEQNPWTPEAIFRTVMAGVTGSISGMSPSPQPTDMAQQTRTFSESPDSRVMSDAQQYAQGFATSGLVNEAVNAQARAQQSRVPSLIRGQQHEAPDMIVTPGSGLSSEESANRLRDINQMAAMQEFEIGQQQAAQTRQQQAEFDVDYARRVAEFEAQQAAARQGVKDTQAAAIETLRPVAPVAGQIDAALEPLSQMPRTGSMRLPLPYPAAPTTKRQFVERARGQVEGEIEVARQVAQNEMSAGRQMAQELDRPERRVFQPRTMADLYTSLDGIRRKYSTVLGRQGESGTTFSDVGRMERKIYDRLMQVTPETLTLDELLQLRREVGSVGKFDGGARQADNRAQSIMSETLGVIESGLRQAVADAGDQGPAVQRSIDTFMSGLSKYPTVYETRFREEAAFPGKTRRVPGGGREIMQPAAMGARVFKGGEDTELALRNLDNQLVKVRQITSGGATKSPLHKVYNQTLDNLGIDAVNKALAADVPIADVIPTLDKIASKYGDVTRAHAEALKQTFTERMAQSDTQTAKLIQDDPKIIDDTLFSGEKTPDLGRNLQRFNKIKPVVDKNPDMWKAAISHKLGQLNPDDAGIIPPGSFDKVLNDPILRQAPPEMLEVIQHLRNMELDPSVYGKPPVKGKFEASPYAPNVNERIWGALKSADDWPKLRSVLTRKALTGTTEFKNQDLPKLKEWMGEKKWKELKEDVVTDILSADQPDPNSPMQTQSDPKIIYDKINAMSEVMRQEIFGDRWKAIMPVLATKEMPIAANIDTLRRAPEQPGVGLRRLGSLMQFAAANAATFIPGLFDKDSDLGTPAKLAMLGATFGLGYMRPRYFAQKMLGQPNDAARVAVAIASANQAMRGQLARGPRQIATMYQAEGEPTGDIRRER